MEAISYQKIKKIWEKGQEHHSRQIMIWGINAGLVKHGEMEFSYSETLEPLVYEVLKEYRKKGWDIILEEKKVIIHHIKKRGEY